jgi:hypothetical protein
MHEKIWVAAKEEVHQEDYGVRSWDSHVPESHNQTGAVG